MTKNVLLIHYEYCSGCRSCELACRNEHNLPKGSWGIRVKEENPWKLPSGEFHWDYIPAPTSLCNLCEERVNEGVEPMCVQSCQAKVIEFGTPEAMAKRMVELDKKVTIFKP